MPRQRRIDDEAFKKALDTLSVDQINSLGDCKTNADIWGALCVNMGKADNIENRRACFDLWKRKEYYTQQVIHHYPQETEHVQNENIIQLDFSHTHQESTRALDKSATQQFIEELELFLNRQGKIIPVKCNHKLDSVDCSGDIVSIQLLCKCENDDIENDNDESRSLPMSLSYDYEDVVRSKNYSVEYEDPTISSVVPPLQLALSPVTSSSFELSVEREIFTSTPNRTEPLSLMASSVEKKKDVISPVKTPDHTTIDEEQTKLLNFLQRQPTDSLFFTFDINVIQQMEIEKSIVISQGDMEKLIKAREEERKKKEKENKEEKEHVHRQSTDSRDSDYNDEFKKQKRSFEWTVIMDYYIKQSNDYCVFMYDRHYFRVGKKHKKYDEFFMSLRAHCIFSTCSCKFEAMIYKNGKLKVKYFGEIRHLKGELHARPHRGSRREQLQQFSALGASPNALQFEQFKLMTEHNKKAGNRNALGSSPSVIRKIASEGNVKLRRDNNTVESLQKIKEEQAKTIFPGEQTPGYLQEIGTDPLRLICFTAGGLAVYHRCVLTMPLSWDATGGIVINRQKRIYYYELTMSNLIKGGPSFPITVMLTDSHGTADIVHWMHCFKEKYQEAYGFRDKFPKPPVIHSDRALVFLLAGIQVFNFDETMDRYIERCWRITQGTANQLDLEITVVHACLGHFMKNVKKNACKVLEKKQVPFGMWLMALLVNSNTLDEMVTVWKNICTVLISTNQNDRFKMSLSLLTQMADQMNKDPDKTNDILKNVIVTPKAQFRSNLDGNAYENDADSLPMGEEEAVLQIQSSYKDLFTRLYEESKEAMKVYDEQQWNNLPSNPLFSATYLARLLKLYMPTAPIWSNLLLGNFTNRYGYKSTSTRPPCSCHNGRTTGVSESRMRVLKNAVLGHKVYSRIDEVVTKLGESIEAVEFQFADFIFMKNNKNRVLPATKQSKSTESWGKRVKTTVSKLGKYTSEAPRLNLTAMMNAQLLGQNDDKNLAIGQLPEFLKFENQAKNCWLNSITQMILSSGNIIEAIKRTGNVTKDVEPSIVMVTCNYLHILASKHNNRSEKGKTIVEQTFLSDHLRYFIWAGVKIRLRQYNCVFDFFQAAIIPTLEFYNIDFEIVINTSIRCSSCTKVSIIGTQTWVTLLILNKFVNGNLTDVLSDMYKPIPGNKECPLCLFSGHQEVSLAIAKFPKHVFIRFHATTTTEDNAHRLSPHIDLFNVISDHIVFTRSYCRYTLQSFIVFIGKDDDGHYYTIANRNNEWYKLDDNKISIVPASTLFGSNDDRPPVVFALYTRSSNKDVFSIALWNVFTNFIKCTLTLPPTLSLNDAVDYFAKYDPFNNNLLNFAVLKQFQCSYCKKETLVIDRLHKIWEMKTTTIHIENIMQAFMLQQIQCSSCKRLGYTNSVVYDFPKFLILYTPSNVNQCVDLIHDVNQLAIRPTISYRRLEYNIQTVLLVLEEDNIIYLKKTSNGYSSYNESNNQFELLDHITSEDTDLASKWTVFVYETVDTSAIDFSFQNTTLDQSDLSSAAEPNNFIIQIVKDLLPSYKKGINVGTIRIGLDMLQVLLDKDGDINDLIIDAHLSITASNSTLNERVLAVPSYLTRQIILRKLKHLPISWIDYDIILCPINQNHHWYIIIIDLQQKLILQLDSLITHSIPRRANMTQILHLLSLQYYLRNTIELDFNNNWKIITTDQHLNMQQTDSHSCGIHLLVQTESYVKKEKFVQITPQNNLFYRYQIAETLIRTGDTPSSDSSSTSLLHGIPDSHRSKQFRSKTTKKTTKK